MDYLKKWLRKIFTKSKSEFDTKDITKYFHNDKNSLPHFALLSIQNTTPPNDSIGDKDFVVVIYKGKPMWALFKCPCGCKTIISLSLQKVHTPHWRLKTSRDKRPTLYPSIWQKTGCHSHFWIVDGYLYWA